MSCVVVGPGPPTRHSHQNFSPALFPSLGFLDLGAGVRARHGSGSTGNKAGLSLKPATNCYLAGLLKHSPAF